MSSANQYIYIYTLQRIDLIGYLLLKLVRPLIKVKDIQNNRSATYTLNK